MLRWRSAELAYDFYYHLTWPIFSQDPRNPPKLVGEGKRGIAAGLAGSAGILTVSHHSSLRRQRMQVVIDTIRDLRLFYSSVCPREP